MANEISLSFRMGVTNGNYDPGTISVSNQLIDQAAAGAVEGIQNIGTSEETLGVGGLSTKGWIFMRNLDATNYIEAGFATTVYGIKLEAGECAMFRTGGSATIYLKANTAACNLQYRWLED